MVSNSVSKYYWLWFGIRAYVQMGVLLHWKIPIQLLFLFPRESLSVPAFRTLTYTKTKQQQHSLLASGLPTSSSLPLPTIFTRKQHRNHVQDCPRPCCCYCFRLGFCPGPKVCCFVKMLRVEIRPHEVAVGLSGFFVPRSNHCSLNCGLHRPLLSLLWGQVGKVWAHYCRGVVVNWTWQLITPFFLCFPLFPLTLTGIIHRQSISRTVVRADSDEYAAQLDKMQKEAEERLDDKVEELMKNIETVGQSN